jgi:predicted TIM-barrel fold metal-dependent hydrolase
MKEGYTWALPEEIISIHEAVGIEYGVLLPLVNPEGNLGYASNEEILEVVSRHPGHFVMFCNIDPRIYSNNEHNDFEYIVSHYKSLGARGVGEINANMYFDDPRVFALFRACEKHDMPMIFHIGDTSGDAGLIDDFGLPRLEKALASFPRLKFLGHSQRFWSHISADVTPDTMRFNNPGNIAHGGRVIELMRKYPNLCGDLSAFSGYNALTRDPDFAYMFMEEFSDRLYYGTDVALSHHARADMLKLAEFLDNAMENGKISYDTYAKISRENALKLLRK